MDFKMGNDGMFDIAFDVQCYACGKKDKIIPGESIGWIKDVDKNKMICQECFDIQHEYKKRCF